jgi:hypothetical protein
MRSNRNSQIQNAELLINYKAGGTYIYHYDLKDESRCVAVDRYVYGCLRKNDKTDSI